MNPRHRIGEISDFVAARRPNTPTDNLSAAKGLVALQSSC